MNGKWVFSVIIAFCLLSGVCQFEFFWEESNLLEYGKNLLDRLLNTDISLESSCVVFNMCYGIFYEF